MALSAKLVMRQGQAMVMTPQLLQAIKLLQLPNIELAAYIEGELERNPLLERAEDFAAAGAGNDDRRALRSADAAAKPEAHWASQELETDAGALAGNLGTEVDNAFGPGPRRHARRICRPAGGPRPLGDLVERGGGRRRRRSGAQSRGLCRGRRQPWPTTSPGRRRSC